MLKLQRMSLGTDDRVRFDNGPIVVKRKNTEEGKDRLKINRASSPREELHILLETGKSFDVKSKTRAAINRYLNGSSYYVTPPQADQKSKDMSPLQSSNPIYYLPQSVLSDTFYGKAYKNVGGYKQVTANHNIFSGINTSSGKPARQNISHYQIKINQNKQPYQQDLSCSSSSFLNATAPNQQFNISLQSPKNGIVNIDSNAMQKTTSAIKPQPEDATNVIGVQSEQSMKPRKNPKKKKDLSKLQLQFWPKRIHVKSSQLVFNVNSNIVIPEPHQRRPASRLSASSNNSSTLRQRIDKTREIFKSPDQHRSHPEQHTGLGVKLQIPESPDVGDSVLDTSKTLTDIRDKIRQYYPGQL